MTNKKKTFHRLLSVLLCLALLLAYFPASVLEADAAVRATTADDRITDPGTAYTWETIMGTDRDGNRYAGRVWADKSVYENGDTAILNTRGEDGSSFQVELQDGEDFQIIYSVLGSSMTTTTTTTSTGPMDIVLILDTSTSMDDTDENNVTRLQRVITAANKLIADLNEIPDVRFAVVTYNADSEMVIPLARYTNGLRLVVNNYLNNNQADAGVVYAYDNSNTKLGNDSGYTMGTNLQAGIDRGFNILANATGTTNRQPVAIVLSDGEANRAVNDNWHTPVSSNVKGGSISAGLALSTLLNAAYTKTKAEKTYGKDVTVYGISVDMDPEAKSHVLMNPGSAENGFNSSNDSSDITSAYNKFVEWKGTTNDVTIDGSNSGGGWWPGGGFGGGFGSTTWTFDHDWPASPAITRAEIAANINYVDSHYDVKSDTLNIAFDQIYEELTSNAFNPIHSEETINGATGKPGAPLVYVDKIGNYMEIKNIQAITLFGASYGITKGATSNGVTTYTVAGATGVNPTTGENWNTADDIKITVTEDSDGVQTLRVEIEQEILPILLEQVKDSTAGGSHDITINEITYAPLRVYYTVGLDSDILLPNGQVDVKEIDKNKVKVDGNKITFYANAFGDETLGDGHKVDATNGTVTYGDAHVGFHPSEDNRYYYYQDHHEIFSSATLTTSVNGSNAITWEEGEYGVVYQEGKYDLQLMTAEEYFTKVDDDKVYTYVTFYRPTASGADATNAAEKVTYLVYTDWKYLKGSVAFWDKTADTYLNDGKVIEGGDAVVQSAIDTYKASNPNAEIYAVLAENSERTSRFHNMIFPKMEGNQQVNPTGTAVNRYAPEFTHETSANDHHGGNTVVVWLGNNGKLTTTVETGIALSKAVTEAIGNANDFYALTVTVVSTTVNTTFTPVVKDASGNELDISRVSYDSASMKLTVKVKAGETVYVTGIPAGAVCTIGEEIPTDAKYYNTATAEQKVTVPTLANVLGTNSQYATATVTNAPNKYGNLFITKEINSDHTIPAGILSQEFDITVELKNGNVLWANKPVTVKRASGDVNMVTSADGKLTLTIKDRETIELLGLPEGITATVVETLTSDQQNYFKTVTYRSRNHSGEAADNDSIVTIPADANATVVILNEYTPVSTTVELDVEITKELKVDNATTWAGGTFTFEVHKKKEGTTNEWEPLKDGSVTYGSGSEGPSNVTISDVLFSETFDSVGTWTYHVIEKIESLPGVAYDHSTHIFTVTVVDNNGHLQATVTKEDGTSISDLDNDQTFEYPVVFKNIAHSAQTMITVTKKLENLSGDTSITPAGFKFKAVRKENDFTTDWPAGSGQNSELTIVSGANGLAYFTASYDAEGEYYYTITEDYGSVPTGWAYSTAKYNVTVKVTEDNTTQDLEAEMTIVKVDTADDQDEVAKVDSNSNNTPYSTGSVVFENTYDPTDTPIDFGNADVEPKILKEVIGNLPVNTTFMFGIFEDGTDTLIMTGEKQSGAISFTNVNGYNDATTGISVAANSGVLTFSKAGKYEFDVKEIIPDVANRLPGMTYDSTVYDLVVEVTDDRTTGQLKAVWYFEDAVGTTVTFKNVYAPTPVEYILDGQKTLSGRAMKEGEFEFEFVMDLSSGNADNIDLPGNATNDVYGNFVFDPIIFKEPGNYTVKVKEVGGSLPGVGYDSDVIEVTFNVGFDTDNKSLKVINADVVEAIAIAFQNTYTTKPAQVTINGKKELKGGALAANDFSFRLYGTDHTFELKEENLVASKTNAADGSFSFTGDFNTTGTYFFALVEDVSNPKDGIVYDRAQHNFRVRVSDVGDGYLRVDVTNMDTNVTTHGTKDTAQDKYIAQTSTTTFTNATFDEVTKKEVYLEGNATTMIDGQKVEAGEILTYFLSYTNYHGEMVRVDILDAIPNHTSYVEGSASHNGTYAAGHVNWVLDVAPNASVTVSFQVKVNETAAIVANTAMIVDGVNTYYTNEVVNHTFDGDEVAEKKVFYPADVTTNIDGKKVYAGEELVYTITYTNASGNPVTDVAITDTIPKHTTYVENSADHDGVYSDGVLTWTIDEVPAWGKVTVAFMVKVDENVEAETITNKAIVKEGNNTYKTNEITNYTVEDEVEKKVALVGQETVNIDGKKVYAGDELVYTIRYKNTARDLAAVVITDTIPEYTTYVDGSSDNNGVYEDGVITWNLEVAAGAEVVVSFKVKVKDAGNVNLVNKAEVKEGKNTYITNSVTNYTVDDDVKKEVFTASKTDVSLDGKKVTPGEELVYKIYYKNSSSEKAIVTITDKISEYTTYVDGSADNNGVYEDGVITWNLEVAAGETVAVSFKATVKDVPGAKVANTATIVEGKNSYTTNEVVNQIPAAPTTPDNSDLPQTGGNARLGMWTALLVLGCSGLIVTSIYSKKKNKSEE